MDNSDLQEMLGMALAAKEARFPRIQIDPADFIEVADQRNQLLAALQRTAQALKEGSAAYRRSVARDAEIAIAAVTGVTPAAPAAPAPAPATGAP